MSDIREMVAESINRMFAENIDRNMQEEAERGKAPSALWQMVEDSGFSRVLVPEHAGGTGGGWTDAYPILHAVGYYRAPLPLVETVIGNDLLSRAGMQPCDGPIAVVQQGGGGKLALTARDGGIVIDGAAPSVAWANRAQHLLIAGTAGGRGVIALVKAGTTGLDMAPGFNIAKEPRDQVSFKGVRATASAFVEGALAQEPVRLCGALARAISMVGAIESVLDQSVQYAKERIQFGRPIGKFQAVQHMLAELACEATAASTAAQVACNAMAGSDPRFDIAVAKVRVGRAAGHAARIAHQVHGAFGMTYDHTLHFGTRRLWSWRAEFGNEDVWASEIGAAAIRRGGANFWSDLTARTVA